MRRTIMNRRRGARLALCAAGGLIWGGGAAPAAAASFQVNPVNILLPADRQTASLTIHNSDSADVAVRVVTYRWTQVDGKDVYSETGDVIASPPIFTIKPGATQLLRVGLKARTGPAYRVVLEEIPRATPGSTIRVALRLNLPLYLLPAGGGKPEVAWRLVRDGSGQLRVEGRNTGTAQAQVLRLAADAPGGGATILSQEMGVILPGSARYWKAGPHPEFEIGSPTLLKVKNPAGETQAQIKVERP